MFGMTSLTILALLVTAFVLVLQHRRKVADLELLTARLRKEVDGIQQRLRALEGLAEAPAATPVVPIAAAVPDSVAPMAVPTPLPPPTPVPQAAAIKVAEVATVAPAAAPATAVPLPPKPAAPPPSRPAPAAPNTPSWIARPDGLVAKAKNWLFTGNLVAKLGLLILFLGVSFLLSYVSAQVTVPIELRLAGIALADIALLAWAWRIRLKRPGISLPLQGTALAILMLVTFGAFRLYELIPAGLAFAVLFVLTAFTCLLAVLQNAVWLAVFGIVGGFAVPLLVSTGSGNHIGLFSYYALLNAGVFAIALKRAWRVLNVLSFGFTFVVATTWGLLRYTPEHYLSTQLFLILFVLFYIGIAIAYCARQAPRLKHYVDGTLVFGTPLAAMGLQYGLVQHFHFGLAFSALLAGLCYTGLAVALWRRVGFKLLAEAFLALGIVFGTLAIPFALDGRWTSAAWALEGAGIVWVGLRQRQTLAWAFGLLVQAAAWISFLLAMQELDTATALHANIWLGCTLLAAAALVMAYNFRSHASHLYPEFMSSLSVLFLTAATAWLLGGLWSEILLRTDAATQLNLLTVSALGVAALLAVLARREQWHAPRALLLAVQVLAGMVMLSRASWAWDQHPASLFEGSFLSALLLGAAAFASARFLALRARGGDALLALVARPLLVWSGLLWFAAILMPLVSWLLRLIDGDLTHAAACGRTLAGAVPDRRVRHDARVRHPGAAPRLAAAALVQRGYLARFGPVERQPAAGAVSARLPADRLELAGPGQRAGGRRVPAAGLAASGLATRRAGAASAAYAAHGRAMADAVARGCHACQRLAGAPRRRRQPCLGPLFAGLGHDAGPGLADPPLQNRRLAGGADCSVVPAHPDTAGRAVVAAADRRMEYCRRWRHGAPALFATAQSAGLEHGLRHLAGHCQLPFAAGETSSVARPVASAFARRGRLLRVCLVQPDAAAHGVALPGRAVHL